MVLPEAPCCQLIWATIYLYPSQDSYSWHAWGAPGERDTEKPISTVGVVWVCGCVSVRVCVWVCVCGVLVSVGECVDVCVCGCTTDESFQDCCGNTVDHFTGTLGL